MCHDDRSANHYVGRDPFDAYSACSWIGLVPRECSPACYNQICTEVSAFLIRNFIDRLCEVPCGKHEYDGDGNPTS